ncbi:MAG: phnD [Peptococcaceae bacterium]|nr:phnD [Peptococcaceae bacterium]
MRLRFFLVMALITGLLVSTWGCSNQQASSQGKRPAKLVMAYLPNEDSAGDVNRKQSRDMLMKDMSAFLGIPVEIVILDDYNAVIETMRNEKTHIAHFGPFSYIIAHDRSKAEAICVMAKDQQSAFYNSLLVTHKDTGIQTIEDIKGKSMAFVDPASTSGNLVPRATIVARLGVKAEEIDTKLFKSVQFAGNHTNSLLAAANKTVDVAAVSTSTYENSIKKGLVKEEDLRIIIKSDPIPSSPVAVYGGLPEDLKAKIKEFFLKYDNPEYFKLRNEEGKRYISIDDSNYNPIRDIAKAMNLKAEELLKS